MNRRGQTIPPGEKTPSLKNNSFDGVLGRRALTLLTESTSAFANVSLVWQNTWTTGVCADKRSKRSSFRFWGLAHYLLWTGPCGWVEVLGGLILLLGGTTSILWPFSPGLWPAAGVSVWASLCALSSGTAAVKDFCLFRMPSLPALISFSPTLTTRALPAAAAVPGHSFLGEGSLDPAPADGGRASLEALDILRVSGWVMLPSVFLSQRDCCRVLWVIQGFSTHCECDSVTLRLQRVVTGAGRLRGPGGGR